MTLMSTGLVTRDPQRVAADPARVITRLFVPGQEGFELQESRAGVVLKRILALSDDDVLSSLDDVIIRFDGRHRDLVGTFRRHARELADRLNPDIHLTDARILLLGATFTSEYAIEGAALCNPSIVAHPDQTDMATGSLRFVMSVRGIGEGHRSSIGFRTGVVDAAGRATIDEPARFATTGSVSGAALDAAVFRGELGRIGNAGEAANYVFNALGERFTRSDLDARLDNLRANLSTRGHGERTVALIRAIATRSYAVEFPSDVSVSERVLWPSMEAEQAGMEDARFVRFVDDDGSVTYYATYTAYSGSHISQQLLKTEDFRVLHLRAARREGRGQQGFGLVPPTNTRSLRRHVAIGPRDQHRRLRRPSGGLDERIALPAAGRAMGSAATRKLRPANRNRRRLAGAHPRRRAYAHV